MSKLQDRRFGSLGEIIQRGEDGADATVSVGVDSCIEVSGDRVYERERSALLPHGTWGFKSPSDTKKIQAPRVAHSA